MGIISGAGLLFFTNLAAIVACAFLVFSLVSMDSLDVRQSISETEMEHASDDWLYSVLGRTVLRHSVGNVGQLRWRVGMILVTLAILFFRSASRCCRSATKRRAALRFGMRYVSLVRRMPF